MPGNWSTTESRRHGLPPQSIPPFEELSTPLPPPFIKRALAYCFVPFPFLKILFKKPSVQY
jgi:hypothetical protein